MTGATLFVNPKHVLGILSFDLRPRDGADLDARTIHKRPLSDKNLNKLRNRFDQKENSSSEEIASTKPLELRLFAIVIRRRCVRIATPYHHQ